MFYKYIRGITRTKESVGLLLNGERKLMDDIKKAKVFKTL